MLFSFWVFISIEKFRAAGEKKSEFSLLRISPMGFVMFFEGGRG